MTPTREPRDERFCDAGRGIRLCYDTIGDPADAPLLLIMGLSAQLVLWEEEFCEGLAERGFFVIRFDNRDAGRSTTLDDRPPPTVRELATRRIKNPAYGLEDMADDAIGLLDHLQIDTAHIMGISLGGMIAQTLTLRAEHRVRSLTSISSSTGSRLRGQMVPSLVPHLMRPLPSDRNGYVDKMMRLLAMVGSPAYPSDPEHLRWMAETQHARGFSAQGMWRQLGAGLTAPNRTGRLRSIGVPALVIHGRADPLIRPSGGRATAAAIPTAHHLEIAGMGHDLPRDLWGLITDAFVHNAARAEGAA